MEKLQASVQDSALAPIADSELATGPELLLPLPAPESLTLLSCGVPFPLLSAKQPPSLKAQAVPAEADLSPPFFIPTPWGTFHGPPCPPGMGQVVPFLGCFIAPVQFT